MQKYSFESWLLFATCVLAGLILLPGQAHASEFGSVDFVAQNPLKFAFAMFACYVGIKAAPSNRHHF